MVIALVVGIGVVVLLSVAPLLLPWPRHVRWLVATVTTPVDPWGTGPGPSSSPQRDAVTVDRVDRGTDPAVEVACDTTGRMEGLRCPVATLTDLARLERWAAAGTPLLMVTDPDGEVSLHGPNFAVAGLQRGQPRACGHASSSEGSSLGELIAADLELHGLTVSSPVKPQVRYR